MDQVHVYWIPQSEPHHGIVPAGPVVSEEGIQPLHPIFSSENVTVIAQRTESLLRNLLLGIDLKRAEAGCRGRTRLLG